MAEREDRTMGTEPADDVNVQVNSGVVDEPIEADTEFVESAEEEPINGAEDDEETTDAEPSA